MKCYKLQPYRICLSIILNSRFCLTFFKGNKKTSCAFSSPTCNLHLWFLHTFSKILSSDNFWQNTGCRVLVIAKLSRPAEKEKKQQTIKQKFQTNRKQAAEMINDSIRWSLIMKLAEFALKIWICIIYTFYRHLLYVYWNYRVIKFGAKVVLNEYLNKEETICKRNKHAYTYKEISFYVTGICCIRICFSQSL